MLKYLKFSNLPNDDNNDNDNADYHDSAEYLEKVDTMEFGHDYGESIKSAGAVENPKKGGKGKKKPKEKKKVKSQKKQQTKEKVDGKSKHQKKDFGADAFKKLNRQYLQQGCGFFGTIGCNRSIFHTFCLHYYWYV